MAADVNSQDDTDNTEEDAEAANEADDDREAADALIIEALDGEDLHIELTHKDVELAAGALSKVCANM